MLITSENLIFIAYSFYPQCSFVRKFFSVCASSYHSSCSIRISHFFKLLGLKFDPLNKMFKMV